MYAHHVGTLHEAFKLIEVVQSWIEVHNVSSSGTGRHDVPVHCTDYGKVIVMGATAGSPVRISFFF